MIVAAFPGQGSQAPGFLNPWLDLDGVRERLEAASESAGVDLVAAGTEWDADRIRDTRVAQPLIVAASIVSYEALVARAGRPAGVAGHSVGEIGALVAAEVISFDDGMRLVGDRGRAMADAAAIVETGMCAVVGGVEEQVLAAITDAGLEPANFNGGGQIVAAGAVESLAVLAQNAPRGSRVIPLQVAGAFHTSFMAPAAARLREAVERIERVSDPALPLWTNSDGSVVEEGAAALDLIVHQISHPVRWDLCMASFQDAGITGLVELAPAGALTGLAKRGLKGVPAVAVKTPDDLDAAAELLA